MKFLSLLLVFLFIELLNAQTNQRLIKENTFNVFIDCPSCDIDYLKEKIEYVNFVWDRKNADVHILFSEQKTGGEGKKVTLFFIGLNKFKNSNDTLSYVRDKDDTDETERIKMAKKIKLGLMRYVAKTPIAEKINIGYEKPVGQEETEKKDDWDFWVFNNIIRSFIHTNQNTKSYFFYGSISANRVTEDWKINFRISGNYNEEVYKYFDDITRNVQRSYGFYSTVIKSIDQHWSVGAWGRISSSAYSNIKLDASISTGIEYNIFPFSISNSKQLRIGYYLRGMYNNYFEETIYFKTKENLFQQTLQIAVNFVQPWGTINSSVSGNSFLHDFKKYSITTRFMLSIKLIKGLSLEFSGTYSKINDQISLPKRGATKEEVLLRQRELETQYRFWGSIGFSYTFGSIYNNIVNPRFD